MKRMNILVLFLVLSLVLTGCAASQQAAPPQTEAVNTQQVSGRTDASAASDTESAPDQSTDARPVDSVSDVDPDAASTEDGAADEDHSPETDPAYEPTPESVNAFVELFPVCPEDVTAVLYNAPFIRGALEATETWSEGEYDQLYLIPRYVGTQINAYELTFTEDGTMQRAASPAYSTVAEAETLIFASLTRPEGMPAWYVETVLPDGSTQGLVLDYNGRIGTPAFEFLQREPEEAYDLTNDVEAAQVVPLGRADLNSFAKAALAAGMDPWEAAGKYFTQITELGDGAAFTESYGHEMDGSVYSFRMAKLHQNYQIETWDLDELVTGQYSIYQQIGNELGILGPEFTGDLPELTYQLTGVTVFNHLLAAKEIRISVNGETVGTYSLPQDQFCTLIALDLPEQTADHPVSVEIEVVSAWYGEPDQAWIDAFGGLTSNISGAI